ncbi:MAG: S41 family peptidase [Gemmataceae bacterium]
MICGGARGGTWSRCSGSRGRSCRRGSRPPSSRPGRRPTPAAGHGADGPPLAGRHILVLVNGQTTGGGELLAAALQDSGSQVVVAGQRTYGKAISSLAVRVLTAPGLVYRTTAGFTLRPTGLNRHRFPDSKPSDPWGVKPDRGFEIPTTPEAADRLREQYEAAAVRGTADPAAAGFDPFDDPQLLVAVKLFKERLAKK